MLKLPPQSRRWLVELLLLAAVIVLVGVTLSYQELESWLLLQHLGLAAIALVWGVSCTGLGFSLVRRVFPLMPLGTKLTLGFALGVVLFGTAVAALGFARGFGPVGYFLVLVPGLVLSVRPGVRAARVVRRLSRLSSGRQRLSLWTLLLAGLALALIYVPTLSPRHLSYDTLWYHLPIAEHYVAAGRIERLEEGWYLGLYPQLASWLYTWALLTPKVSVVNRSLLCMQLEFVIFIGTLAAIPALTRAVLAGVRVRRGSQRWSWLLTFAFPSVFLYDLVAAADHVSALFFAPACLLLLRGWNKPSIGLSAMLGAFISGGMLTKYSAVILFSPLAAAWGVRTSFGMVPAWRGAFTASAWRNSLASFVGVGVALTSSHWLKNWIWYGSPLYPMVNGLFRANPWHDHAAAVYHGWITSAVTAPKGGLMSYVTSAAEVFRFSFVGHDFHWLTKGRPMMGSLFTLLLLPFLIVSRSKRTLGLALLLHASVLLWAFSHAQDRFLQTILPAMVAVTAAAVHVLWQTGAVTRYLLSTLVGFQTLWGSDVLAWPYRHQWYTDVVGRGAASLEGKPLLGDGYFSPWTDVARKLPAQSKLLVHDVQIHYGTGARVVNDWSPTQGALDYGALGSPEAVRQSLVGLGVSHVVWYPAHSSGGDSLAGDIYFHLFARKFLSPQDVAGVKFAQLDVSQQSPAGDTPAPSRAVYLGCGGVNRDGVYDVAQLHLHPQANAGGYPPPVRPFSAPTKGKLVVPKDASLLVVETACAAKTSKPPGWTLLFKSAGLETWVEPLTR